MRVVAPRAPECRPRRRSTPLAGSTLLVMLASVLAGCSPAETVMLEGRDDPGQDAFTASVADDVSDAFTETVVAQLAERTTAFEADSDTGIRIAPALTPGLYGDAGTVACDVGALLSAITAGEALAGAWAEVVGMTADGIPEYLGGLTPAVLTIDTAVTNHGYADGRAIPRAAVLQAGTAVLVDSTGVPAVRCACGNPLLPARDGIALSNTSGTAWVGYSAESVVTVRPGAPTASFTLTDVRTGDLFDRRAGSTIGELLVLTAVEGEMTAQTTGAVYASRDGADWTRVLESGRSLDDVAASADLAVAVGRDASGGGIVHASADGLDWGAAIPVAEPLGAVGFGAGRWLAAGTGSAGAVVYASSDGASWDRIGAVDPPREGDSLAPTAIAYGSGTWAMVATECQYRVCMEALLTSTDDGTTWAHQPLADTVYDVSVAHDGTSWGAVGAEIDPDSVFTDMASLGADSLGIGSTSGDPAVWDFAPTDPSRVWLTALAPGLGDWLALDIIPYGSRAAEAPNGLHRSADAVSWTRAGTTPAGASAVAALRSFADLDVVEAAAPAPAPEPGPREGAFVTIGTTGLEISAGSDSSSASYAGSATDAVAELTAYLGPGTTTTRDPEQCTPNGSTTTSWGSFTVHERPGDSWFVVVDPAAPAEIDVRLPGGLTLPVTDADLQAAHPDGLEFADAGSDYAQYFLTPEGGKGVQVVIHEGRIRVTAPTYPDDGVGHGCIV